jgi:hypothetical protein
MKPEQIYEELKDISERMGITVKEQSFRSTGVKAKSGHVIVKGEQLFIMDKHKKIRDKNQILIDFMRNMPHEDIFIVPAVRDLLGKIG